MFEINELFSVCVFAFLLSLYPNDVGSCPKVLFIVSISRFLFESRQRRNCEMVSIICKRGSIFCDEVEASAGVVSVNRSAMNIIATEEVRTM